MQPKILIVDDHQIVRDGVRTLIERSRPDWQICGEATNGNEALLAVAKLSPDVVILDITMPGESGLEAAPRILSRSPMCRIVIFTMHESDSLENEVRSTGAHGYVLKSEASQNLILAIETILSGGSFYGNPSPLPPDKTRKINPGMAYWLAPALGTI